MRIDIDKKCSELKIELSNIEEKLSSGTISPSELEKLSQNKFIAKNL